MRLSAIIPTHDRPESLAQCLETLMEQDVVADRLEVVVVDDGSRSDIPAVVAASSARGSIPVRCERQPLSGLNVARNRGAAVATGDVLAFLDDDTLVSPGWASALLRAFESHPCAGVGGRVELGLAAPAPDWLTREFTCLLAEYDVGREARWLEGDPVPVGANCAVRRGEFERIGGFRPGLDRIAGSLVSNGDTEFFRRLRAAGGRLRYEPEAKVVHCIPAERLTVRYFIKRHRAQGVSDELLLRLEGHSPTFRHKVELARDLGRANAWFCKEVLRGGSTVRPRFWSSYMVGRLAAARVASASLPAGSDSD